MQGHGEGRIRSADGGNDNRPRRERREPIRRNRNQQVNINVNHHRVQNCTQSTDEGRNGSDYRNVQQEGIPRERRARNRPQVYPRGGRQEEVARDQRRTARWRLQLTNIAAKNKARFQEGADQLLTELVPTHLQIVEGMNKNQLTSDKIGIMGPNQETIEASNRHAGYTSEGFLIRELLEQWQGGAHGYVPEIKNDNIIRLACENVNSLSLYQKGSKKIRKLLNLISRHQTDGMCMVEHGINFGHAESTGEQSKEGIFSSISGSRISAGYNKHENNNRYMTGGTIVSTFSRLSSFVIEQGVDMTGLGRWSWILVGSGDHRTIIVSAYQPHKSSNTPRIISSGGKMIGCGTVASQHRRYFRTRGNCNNPRELFTAQLITQLKAWRAKGYEIILFADLNENVYTGRFSRLLQQQQLLMEEQTLQSTGQKAPKSHQTGKIPIVGTFATPGILCVNSYLSPHGTGVGDHRFQLHDFDANSVLGVEYHKSVRPTGRSLRASNVKARKKYIKRLKRYCVKHRVFEKLENLHINKSILPRVTVETKFNRWDKEVTELMIGSESRCNQFYNGTIEFSPCVGVYVRIIRIYKWIQRFQEGIRVNKKNLWRTCRRKKLPRPSSMTKEYVLDKIDEYTTKLKELEEKGPKLREEHLAICLAAARKKKKKTAIKGIIKTIRKEASYKRWRKIGKCIRPERGGGN